MNKRKFKSWAFLNEAGKKEWEDVFSNGIVPVISWIPRKRKLGNTIQNSYLVDFSELEEDQINNIVERISKKFNAPKKIVKEDLVNFGLPLRTALTSGSGTNQLGLII